MSPGCASARSSSIASKSMPPDAASSETVAPRRQSRFGKDGGMVGPGRGADPDLRFAARTREKLGAQRSAPVPPGVCTPFNRSPAVRSPKTISASSAV